MSIFEKASRLQLRFASTKGSLSVEDLWGLSLESLDTLAKAVNKQIKAEIKQIASEICQPKSTIFAIKIPNAKQTANQNSG